MKSIPHDKTISLSSQQMEDLETRDRIIKLGKAIVTELGLDNSVDTLARWMAHYVAEQMDIAENATGIIRESAAKNCFDTILKLWEHQASLPMGRRPLQNFESIFRALERLDPENEQAYFWANDIDNPMETPEEVKYWLDVALNIDKVARIWLDDVFKQATLSATDYRTMTWLKNGAGLRNKESSILVRFLDKRSIDDEMSEGVKKRELIESKISQLKAFIGFSEELLSIFEKELKTE